MGPWWGSYTLPSPSVVIPKSSVGAALFRGLSAANRAESLVSIVDSRLGTCVQILARRVIQKCGFLGRYSCARFFLLGLIERGMP